VAGERVAHNQLLDGERLSDAALSERTHHGFGDAEVGK
jgi:hypothetical protein